MCQPHENADVYIVNTCTVTHTADRTSSKMIRRTARKNSNALIVVTGCHAESWNDPSLSNRSVLKIPQQKKENLFAKVEEALFGITPEISDAIDYHTISPLPLRTKAYLKIQDGCDRFCSFCIIPFIRGRSSSMPVKQVLLEAENLIQKGHKEIVVTGICVGDYGRDLAVRSPLSELMESLLSLTSEVRWRLSSIDPCDIDEKLIQLLANRPNFCKHLHLALQHGSNRLLKRMGRDYTTQEFFILCQTLKRKVPHIAITTDLIIGFPGETEEDFLETCSYVKRIAFSKIHVFPYSERKGTGAVKHAGKVPQNIKHIREKKVLEISKQLSIEFYSSCLGTTQEVLVEQMRDQKSGLLQGYASNYIPVLLDGADSLKGKLMTVLLDRIEDDKVYGRGLSGFSIKSP